MESITLKQIKDFDRKRIKWIEDFTDFKTRWSKYTEELKNTNTHSLKLLTLKRRMFEEEQAKLNAATAEINSEYKEIKAFMLCPDKYPTTGGAGKWPI